MIKNKILLAGLIIALLVGSASEARTSSFGGSRAYRGSGSAPIRRSYSSGGYSGARSYPVYQAPVVVHSGPSVWDWWMMSSIMNNSNRQPDTVVVVQQAPAGVSQPVYVQQQEAHTHWFIYGLVFLIAIATGCFLWMLVL